jgi:hypothetical protein
MERRVRRRRESAAHAIADGLKEQQRLTLIKGTGTDGAVHTTSYQFNSPKSGATKSITASAQVVYSKTVGSVKRPGVQPWQTEAWDLRAEIGEFRFCGDRPARAASQATLFGAESGPDGDPVMTTNPTVLAITEQLFGTQAQVAQVIHRAVQHLGFNGETLFRFFQTENERLQFEAHAVNELTGSSGGYKLNDGMETRNLGEEEVVVRCWTPDPRAGAIADCAARGVLGPARELKGLTEHTSAQIDSRLAGNGLLLVPNNITVMEGQVPQQSEESIEAGEAFHPFLEALVEAMITPIKDRSAASALVPLVAMLNPEDIEKIRHLTFGSTLDPMAKDLREEAIKRIALGMDSPPEVLLGLGSANHWSAWQVSEEEVTMVIAPLLATVCHSITVGFLWPALEQQGIDNYEDYQVWFDTSRLSLRPDRSQDAQSLFDKGAFSLSSLLRENGFDEQDLPGDEESQRSLLISLVKAAPSLAPILLPVLGIEIPSAALEQGADTVAAVGGTAPSDAATTPEVPADDGGGDNPPAGGDRSIPDTQTDAPDNTPDAP